MLDQELPQAATADGRALLAVQKLAVDCDEREVAALYAELLPFDDKLQRDPKYMIGSGAYKFENWITNDRVILHRDTNYWMKDRPWADAYVDQIIFKTIKDPNATLIALKHQDIDIDQALTPAQNLTGIDSTQAGYIQKDTMYENVYRYIGWNGTRPLFSDKAVRKALTMLIDRDKIIKSILHGLTKKINGPVAPTQPNYDPTVTQPDYSVENAKKALAAPTKSQMFIDISSP